MLPRDCMGDFPVFPVLTRPPAALLWPWACFCSQASVLGRDLGGLSCPGARGVSGTCGQSPGGRALSQRSWPCVGGPLAGPSRLVYQVDAPFAFEYPPFHSTEVPKHPRDATCGVSQCGNVSSFTAPCPGAGPCPEISVSHSASGEAHSEDANWPF